MRATPGEIELDGRPTPAGTLLRQIWGARGLIAILARKNFYVRYRRASFGMFWVVGLPLFQASVLAVVFTHFRQGDAPGGSFAAYVISGFMVWSFFTNAVSTGSNSIVEGASLSSRIYFPRAVLPLSQVASNLHGYGATVVLMIGVALVIRGAVEPTLPVLVPAIALMVLMATSLCLVLSAIQVYFRDVRYVVTAVMQPWFFLTPIIWNAEQLPESLSRILRLNPAAGFVDLTRLAVIGEAPDGWQVSVAVAIAFTAAFAALALYLHARFDRVFADRL